MDLSVVRAFQMMILTIMLMTMMLKISSNLLLCYVMDRSVCTVAFKVFLDESSTGGSSLPEVESAPKTLLYRAVKVP